MERYDAVIIGSGMGGLCTAYIMAKEGMKVCVLEKNRQIGGSLQIFSRDKTIFDTGVHYIGSLAPGQNLYRYFKYFGLMEALKLHKMDEDGFDVITFGGDDNKYPHAQGYENFVEQLCKFFPEERDNLNFYIKKIREVCAAFPLYNLESGTKDFLNAWYLNVDTKAFIDSITKNQRLAEVLGGSNILYAGLENVTPFYVHALVVNSYIESSYRCIDGSSQITRHLSNAIKKMGGEIFNYCEAVRFHFKGDEIDEVELKNGDRIAGKLFVSGIDLAKTVDMVEGPQLRVAYKNRIKGLENSCSSLLVNAVVKEGAFPYINHNVYHYKIPNVWNGPSYNKAIWPEGVAVFPGTSSKHPDFTENFSAMAYMKYEEVKKWENTFHTVPNYENSRGQDYEDFKTEHAEKVLEDVYKRLPELRGNVKSYTSATPLTYRDYIGSRDGTLYGIIKDYNEPLKSFITPRTKIKNLFLTGQNLNLHGVMGVTVSAVVTCSEILGHPYIIEKIKAAAD